MWIWDYFSEISTVMAQNVSYAEQRNQVIALSCHLEAGYGSISG